MAASSCGINQEIVAPTTIKQYLEKSAKRCLSSKMKTIVDIKEYNLLIDGAVSPAAQGTYFESINPSTGEVFARVANAAIEDMTSAIKAARNAFDHGLWSRMSVAERGIYLKKVAQLIRKYAKELSELETSDCGKTIKQSTFIDVPTAADTFEYFGSITNQLDGRTNPVQATVKSITEHEPIGVVGCIIPWNYPLIMAAWKMAPALIAGNTVIFKPSSAASVSVLRLAQIIKEADLPSGVVNVIASDNHEVASELITSTEVNMISFTGGTETGRGIMRHAADTIKKLSLELGGKSPNIVFADCDQGAAIGGTMSAIFMNQGQMCTAGSRLLLEDKIYDEFLTQLVKKTKSLKIGDADDYQTAFGPLINREHRDKVLNMVKQAVENGAKLECGGNIPKGLEKGSFLEPTIFTEVKNDMAIAQEEVFGPVLSVIKFSDVEEAIRIANDTKYGLAACVWTKDSDKANRVSKKLQCGTVWVNTYGGFYNEASFGGYKQSGFGRELGMEGLLEYTQSKHVCNDMTPGGRPLVSSWF